MSLFPFSQLSSYMLSSDSWCHNRNKHGYTRIQNGKWHKRCESFPTRMLFAFEILHTVPCCSSTKRSPFKIKALWLACEDAKEKPWESSSVCSQRCLAVDPSIDLFFYDWASGFSWSMGGNLFEPHVLWLCMWIHHRVIFPGPGVPPVLTLLPVVVFNASTFDRKDW